MVNQATNNNTQLNLHSGSTTGYKDIFWQLEQAIGADVQNVNQLVQKGIITNKQGQYLLAQLAGKAQQLNMYKNLQPKISQEAPVPATTQPEIIENQTDIFSNAKPGFFDEEGRVALKNYLNGYQIDKDEILKIAGLVEGLENSAVDRYLRKSAYDKSLNDENELAKRKLTAYAQNSPSTANNNRIFTREQISKMSGDEFTQNERLIFEQAKQGLIK